MLSGRFSTADLAVDSLRKRASLILSTGFFLLCLAGCTTGSDSSRSGFSGARPHKAEDLLVVDCFVPGHMIQQGQHMAYQTPPRSMKITATECRVQGGQYAIPPLEVWQQQADKGDKVAQTYVGEIYENGMDYTRAAEWYRRAAEQGYARAQINLGSLYERGLGGLPKNPQTALTWYRTAMGVSDPVALDPGTATELQGLREQIRRSSGEVEALRNQLNTTLRELEKLRERKPSAGDKVRQDKLETSLRQGQQREAELEKTIAQLNDRLARREHEVVLSKKDYGSYHALVIGINDYQYPVPKLTTAVNDAEAVSKVLREKYNFKVKFLRNADATLMNILMAVHEFKNTLTEQDNLLIYYAGHGELSGKNGSWLPVDADPQGILRIENANFAKILDDEKIRIRHILVVADSCYAGTLTRLSLEEPDLSEGLRLSQIKAKVNVVSRTALISGDLRPVVVAGGSTHSVFAQAFIEVLTNNNQIMDGSRLHKEIYRRVVSRTKSVPAYGKIPYTKDEGGEFFFVPTTYAAQAPAENAYTQGHWPWPRLAWVR